MDGKYGYHWIFRQCRFKVCPFCGGSVEYAGIKSGYIFPAAHTGQMYLCNRCGYQGSFILEIDDAEAVKETLAECRHLVKAGELKTPSFRFPGNWIWFWRGYLALLVVMSILGPMMQIYGMFQ